MKLTSVEYVNLVGLTVKFAVTTEEIKKSAISNSVTRVAPPPPWSFSSCSLYLFPPHFPPLLQKLLNKTKRTTPLKKNQTFFASNFNLPKPERQEKVCEYLKNRERGFGICDYFRSCKIE